METSEKLLLTPIDENAQSKSLLVRSVLSLVIGSFWAAGTQITQLLETEWSYPKPVLITFANSFVLGLACTLALLCLPPSSSLSSSLSPSPARRTLALVLLFACLDFGANAAFQVALGFTSASSALSLEQLTTVYVCAASYWLFRERFPPLKLSGLLFSVVGNTIIVFGDHSSSGGGHSNGRVIIGDLLVALGVCGCASAYMIILKKTWGCMSLVDLLRFFRLKCLLLVLAAGPVLALCHGTGFEPVQVPGSTQAWLGLIGAAVCSSTFNLCLNWCLLSYSPLSARLAILLGLPVSLLIDLVRLGPAAVTWQRVAGMSVLIAGLALFQWTDQRASRTASEEHEHLTEDFEGLSRLQGDQGGRSDLKTCFGIIVDSIVSSP